MKVKETAFNGLVILEPSVFGDNRGWFAETYNKNILLEAGIAIDFVQDNQSYSAEMGTLRGMHYQLNPAAQTKLIRCTRGKIFDAVIDLRRDEPTFKQWFGIELTAENHCQLLIPQGFAHGFMTLTPDVEVQYKVDAFYSQAHERSLLWNDPEIGIEWPLDVRPVLSDKDTRAARFAEAEYNF
jgi:dTDP-4-dehydrorhamnose 3,5-epimerase